VAAAGYLCTRRRSCKAKGLTIPVWGMVKPYDARRSKLEQLAKDALAKVTKMERGRKGQYTEGPSVKLWRVLTGKKMLASIREKWTAEQLVHMTAHARGEEGMAHMRVNKPPTSQVVTPKRREAQQATNLAACFHLVLATVNGNAPKERAAACEAAMSAGGVAEEPWAVLEIEALMRAIARWERKEDYVKDV
jgi:hypothetical protein